MLFRSRWLSISFFVLCAIAASFRAYSLPHAQAGALTSVSASAASTTISATTTYTISFTAASAIPSSGGRINFQFNGPSGTGTESNTVNFNSATLANTTSPSTLSIYSYNWNGLTLSTSQNIAAGTNISIVVNNVVNPARGGYYFAHIWTSSYYTDLDGTSAWAGDYNTNAIAIGSNINVTGTITDSSGDHVPFTSVSIYSGNNYYSGYTDKSGHYGFNSIPAGTYTFDIYYYSSATNGKTYFPPDRSTITVASSGVTTKNASFAAATKTISGHISKDTAGGAAVTDSYVYVYKQNGSGWASTTVDSSGNYSLKVTGGSWVANPSPSSWPATWTYAYSYETINFANDATTETKTKDFIVESLNSTVSGKIKLADGSTPTNIYSVGLSFSNTKNQWFSAQLTSDGSFTAKTTAGTFSVSGWVSTDLGHGFPKVENFSVGVNETKDLGTITLVKKTDKIVGKVTDTNGAAVSGASISAWKSEGGYDWGYTTTASDGTYEILVLPGSWQVSAWPQWKDGGSDYVTSGKPETVTVTSGTPATKNFTFQNATNTLNVMVTDPDGNTLTDLSSWASAGDGSQDWGNIGGSISRGVGKLKVPKGTWTVRVYIYSGEYSSPDAQNVTFAGDNEEKSISLKALKNNVTLSGTIYDEDGNKITNKWLSIYASRGKNGSWQSATLDQAAGTYSMKISAGTWRLGWWIDQSLGYSAGSGQDIEVTVAENESKTVDIKLKKANATIKGKAKKPNGEALQWAWITADTRDPNEKKTADSYYYANGASSNATGDYEIKLPAGTYFVGGNMWYGSGYINPKRQKVTVEADKTAELDLVFRTADATITGTTRLDSGGVSAYITAWAEDGGYSEVTSSNDGAYSLSVSKGTKWHVRSIKQDGNTVYKSKETIVDLTNAATSAQDLDLIKQDFTLPDAQVVTFDATKQQAISLDDGTTLTIPANAIANSGTVTLTITPDAALPEQGDAKPLSYGYDMNATGSNGNAIEKFNSNVTLEVPYTEKQLDATSILDAEELQLGYYDDAAGVWHEIDNCTVSEGEKTVTCQFDHFTRFAVVSAADTTPPAAPSSITATTVKTKVTVKWTKPTDADFASVTIYRSQTAGQLGDKLTNAQTGTTYEDTVTSGVTYYYTLRSVDTSGNESASSEQIPSRKLPNTGLNQAQVWLTTLVGVCLVYFAFLRFRRRRRTKLDPAI